jgi:hypothetical protein
MDTDNGNTDDSHDGQYPSTHEERAGAKKDEEET